MFRRKQVVVNAQLFGIAWKKLSGESHQRAGGMWQSLQLLSGLLRVIEAAGSVPGHATERIRVVVVLSAQELFVVVQFFRQMHLMAGRAELSSLMQRLQKRLLVERRLGFDELVIDPLQNGVVASKQTVLQRLVDCEVGIPAVLFTWSDDAGRRCSHAGTGRRMVEACRTQDRRMPH